MLRAGGRHQHPYLQMPSGLSFVTTIKNGNTNARREDSNEGK